MPRLKVVAFFVSMKVKFDPILNKLREKDIIKELSTDPTSPSAQDAWVLKTSFGGTGGGKIQAIFGLGNFYTNPNSATTYSYQLSYRTIEGTTKRVTLS